MSEISYNEGIVAYTGTYEGPDQRAEFVKNHQKSAGILFHEGKRLPCTIVSPSIAAAQNISFAVGMPNADNLFVSDEVPDELKREWLTHEVLCLPNPDTSHCWDVDMAILETLAKKDPRLAQSFVQKRAMMVASLDTYFNSEGAKTTPIIRAKISHSHEQYRQLLAQKK